MSVLLGLLINTVVTILSMAREKSMNSLLSKVYENDATEVSTRPEAISDSIPTIVPFSYLNNDK